MRICLLLLIAINTSWCNNIYGQNKKVLDTIGEKLAELVLELDTYKAANPIEEFGIAVKGTFIYRDSFLMNQITKLRFATEVDYDSVVNLVVNHAIDYFWDNKMLQYQSSIDSNFTKFAHKLARRTAVRYDKKYNIKNKSVNNFQLMLTAEAEVLKDSLLAKELTTLSKKHKGAALNSYLQKRYALVVQYSKNFRAVISQFLYYNGEEQLIYYPQNDLHKSITDFVNQYKNKNSAFVAKQFPEYKSFAIHLDKIAAFNTEYHKNSRLTVAVDGTWYYETTIVNTNKAKSTTNNLTYKVGLSDLYTNPMVKNIEVTDIITGKLDKDIPEPPPLLNEF